LFFPDLRETVDALTRGGLHLANMVHRARASKARKSSHKRASEDVFIAEKILGQRDLSKGLHEGDHNRYEYLVRWKGFDASGDTWEPAKNILSQEL
jgi:hypothetical protein